MTKPKLYIVTGLPYAGKTVLSRELVRRFGFGYASVDAEIDKGSYDITKMVQHDWDDVYTRAFDKLEALLQSGTTTVFDGASLQKSQRQMLREIAVKCGAEPVLIYVNTPYEEITRRRVANMTTRQRGHLEDASMNDALAMFEEPAPDEKPVIYHANLDLNNWINTYIGD